MALPAEGGPRHTLWLLRVTFTLHAVMAVAQPLLIGGYLDGDYGLLAVHRNNANLLSLVSALALVAAVLYAARGRGAWHPTGAMAVMVLAEGAQIGLGYARVLSMHVPLGILVVVGSVVLGLWVWTPRASRGRS